MKQRLQRAHQKGKSSFMRQVKGVNCWKWVNAPFGIAFGTGLPGQRILIRFIGSVSFEKLVDGGMIR